MTIGFFEQVAASVFFLFLFLFCFLRKFVAIFPGQKNGCNNEVIVLLRWP